LCRLLQAWWICLAAWRCCGHYSFRMSPTFFAQPPSTTPIVNSSYALHFFYYLHQTSHNSERFWASAPNTNGTNGSSLRRLNSWSSYTR
jgi:hypothetical protein